MLFRDPFRRRIKTEDKLSQRIQRGTPDWSNNHKIEKQIKETQVWVGVKEECEAYKNLKKSAKDVQCLLYHYCTEKRKR